MRLMKLLLPAMLMASLCSYAYALADTGGGVNPPDLSSLGGLNGAPLYVALGCMILAYVLRRVTTDDHLFHSPQWMWFSTALAAVAGAVADAVISNHGFHSQTLIISVMTALMTLIGQSKPVASGGGAAMILFFVGLTVSGCVQPKNGGTTPTNQPTPTQAYEQKFLSCMESKGLQVLNTQGPAYLTIGLQVFQLLTNPGTQDATAIEKQLENMGIATLGQGASDADSCAVLAWMQVNPVPSSVGMASTLTLPPTPSQVAARIYIARHTQGVH